MPKTIKNNIMPYNKNLLKYIMEYAELPLLILRVMIKRVFILIKNNPIIGIIFLNQSIISKSGKS